MKKTLVAAILGLVTAAAVNAQSYIKLDTYNTPTYPKVNYGAGSGGTVGQPIANGAFTFGFYFVAGNQTGAINGSFDGSGTDIPSGMQLASGPGATTPAAQSGYALAAGSYTYDAVATAGAGVTVVVVAYNGASYASSDVRGHSSAFTYTATYVGDGPAPGLNNFTGFSVLPVGAVVPEPSTFALAGLGLASLLIFRRRK